MLEVSLDELPDSVSDIIEILESERAHYGVWLEFAVRRRDSREDPRWREAHPPAPAPLGTLSLHPQARGPYCSAGGRLPCRSGYSSRCVDGVLIRPATVLLLIPQPVVFMSRSSGHEPRCTYSHSYGCCCLPHVCGAAGAHTRGGRRRSRSRWGGGRQKRNLAHHRVCVPLAPLEARRRVHRQSRQSQYVLARLERCARFSLYPSRWQHDQGEGEL